MSSLALIVVVTAFTALITDTSAVCSSKYCEEKYEINEDNFSCRLANEALGCFEKSVNEKDCLAVKAELEKNITEARQVLKQFGCPSDAASLMASLGLCLALSGGTHFLMNFK